MQPVQGKARRRCRELNSSNRFRSVEYDRLAEFSGSRRAGVNSGLAADHDRHAIICSSSSRVALHAFVGDYGNHDKASHRVRPH